MPRIELTERARSLRERQTDVERLLWGKLRNRRLCGWKWKRQVPRGRYVVDFLCVDANLVVELDGSQHIEQTAYDARRTRDLEAEGLRVLRFWNPDVFEDLDSVCETILAACEGRLPLTLPSPQRGEG